MPSALPPVNDVLQASLAWQRARIEQSAMNVARANVALPPDAAMTGAMPVARDPGFADALSSSPAASPPVPVRLALEPGNPQADANGFVRYPAVDLAAEMTTMMAASRAYEASVRAYNLVKSMNAGALQIGK